MSKIEGVEINPLKKIPDDRGSIYHMLRNDDPVFESFGEIYFSKIYPNVIKAWHLHKEMTLNYAVVSGMIKLVLHDDRQNSTTRGVTEEIYLGDENYCLVKIPPQIWNGFKCVGSSHALVANCSSIPHTKEEIVYLDPFDESIGYSWDLKHR